MSACATLTKKTWGTYRPHLYFGLKAKHVQSPLFGLMWYKQPNNDVGTKKSNIQLRHWCKHEDPVVFLWHDHDGRSFGIQNIEDGANVALDTDAQTGNSTYGFIFYFAIPSNGSRGDMIPKYRLDGNNLKVLDFLSPDFGQLSLQLAVKDNTGNVDMTGLDKLVSEALHTTSPDNMLELQDTGLATESPNFAAVHLVVDASAVNQANIEITIRAGDEQLPVSFAQELDVRRKIFEKRFDRSFPGALLEQEPQREAAQTAVSNLLGGIGFWHGSTPVRNDSGFVREYGPLSIISAVPSRSWFPRAFLWDEGFHQLIVKQIDPELSMEIIGAWLDTMDEHGWIPREQALDTEALSYIPKDFTFESNVANPPMFIYLIGKFMDDPEAGTKFGNRLRQLYPRLKQLYLWLRTTQSGPGIGKMRWRGRNSTTKRELNPETLPSGFDDYLEHHILLMMNFTDKKWVPEIKKDVKVFNHMEMLDELHWSEKSQQYCDYGLHSTNLTMVEQVLPDGTKEQVRQVLAEPKLGLVEDVNGYSNLFPFLLQILPPDSEKLIIMLKTSMTLM
uniref:Mannosyl-oligosaccharide glucosidase n=1 Tax=Ditylenchus dipsaci TaxID=166011 RepID=A0A915DRG4_9BILA